jgi:DNA-binding Xre family transcriptional regulator
MDSTLASRLRAAIEARGMTPPDLIRATGLSRAAVYFLLDGTTTAAKVRSTTVDKLCKALAVSRDYLVDGRGPMVEPVTVSAQSETVRLDPGIVATVATAMGIYLGRRGQVLDLTDPEQAAAFSDAYAELVAARATPSPELTAGAVVADLMAVREMRRERAGSGDAGGVSGASKGGRK